VRSVSIGCVMILGSCLYLVLLGVSSQVNVFLPLTGLLLGLAALLSGIDSLMSGTHKIFALRIRLFVFLIALLSATSAVATVLRDQGFF